jgi:uncharacterized membrane protein YdbT with pleckstrin-like domain
MPEWEGLGGNNQTGMDLIFPIANPTDLATMAAIQEATVNDESEEEQRPLWKLIYTSFVLLLMFIALISDKIGADMIMMVALTLLMASKIITIQEGLEGFSNEGLLTVLVLFVVAAGISHTGALVSLFVFSFEI